MPAVVAVGAAASALSSSSPSTASTGRPVLFADSRKRRKRNADRSLPERADVGGVGCSRLLSCLLSFERRLDASIARRYVDVQEAVCAPMHSAQTMRLVVYHTWNGARSGWTLRLLGEWVDDVEGSVGVGSAVGGPLRVLGSILSSLIVQLDPQLYPGEAGLIEWHKHSTPAVSDGFELHRLVPPNVPLSSFPCAVKLLLYPDYSPALYTLSTSLSRLLSLRQATHVQVLRLLWSYVVQRSLLTSQAPPASSASASTSTSSSDGSASAAGVISPDEALSVVLGHSTPVTLAQLNSAITAHHLLAPEPIILNYSITAPSTSAPFHASAPHPPSPPPPPPPVAIFDVSLPLPELPSLATMGQTLQSTFASFAQAISTSTSTSSPPASNTTSTAATSLSPPTASVASSTSATASALSPVASAATSTSASSSASPPAPLPPPSVPPSLSREWKELSSLSDAMSGHLTELHRISRRRDLLHAFAHCPVDTLHLLLTQQTRHCMNTLTTQRADQAEKRIRQEQQLQLAVASVAPPNAANSIAHLHLGSSRSVALTLGEEEKARRGRYYTAEWMADAVDRYLAQQPVRPQQHTA